MGTFIGEHHIEGEEGQVSHAEKFQIIDLGPCCQGGGGLTSFLPKRTGLKQQLSMEKPDSCTLAQ